MGLLKPTSRWQCLNFCSNYLTKHQLMCLSLYEYSHFSVCNGKLFKDPKLTVEQILAVLQLYCVKTNPYKQVHQEEQQAEL